MNEDRITGRRAGIHKALSDAIRTGLPKWQDIATAPRDGTRVLLCWAEADGLDEHVELGRWRGGWANTYGRPFFGGDPDYFMLLPPPPSKDDITAGLEALSEPIVAEWGEVKDRLNLGKED